LYYNEIEEACTKRDLVYMDGVDYYEEIYNFVSCGIGTQRMRTTDGKYGNSRNENG
jgi:hypothetical protein